MHIFQNRILTKLIKYQIKALCNSSHLREHNLKPPWKILFFGTDEFSLASLKALHSEYRKGDLLNKLEVVTSLKNKKNAVCKFASKEQLVVYNWPISSPECHGFHVGLVVSFGHLIPKDIITAFPLGMLNVHASLLPRWRGAAPIIYALANGDKKTGVTIMKIKPDKFDIGEIVTQASVDIPDDTKMPDLYHTLAILGAQTLVEVLDNLPANLNSAVPQSENGITFAPRIDSKIAYVDWQRMSAKDVYNLQRAIMGMFHLTTKFNNIPIKLYDIHKSNKIVVDNCEDNIKPGSVVYDKKHKTLQIQCADGNWIMVKTIGVPGKRMSAADFNNGFVSKQTQKLVVFR
ncbi:hypothetical protein ILUMI_21459 [Ignelater luminosus]|uniref:Methionyl-tRNA formyltransferase, mitochondrial n=1 Tax=Ignelater luminosus TaxID=2038154 RepID=A0A8K0CHR5_IGNLU|nr:hypothetical protein ILUMI_21459 [Ignelater luminosus]